MKTDEDAGPSPNKARRQILLPRPSTASSSRPSTAAALYPVSSESRPLTAKVTEQIGIERDLGDLMHPALPANPILAPRSYGDNFRIEHHKLMMDRGGLLPPNIAYQNPTLGNQSSGNATGVSFRKEYRLLQMGGQGLNPPKHDPGFDHR
mmetsp:Transcript_13087/g.21278  ORF Transcript_13087/g.21278 Transcript_13087/m.21278 type:complete len:150 (+) Transcript_13087:76-525(+)